MSQLSLTCTEKDVWLWKWVVPNKFYETVEVFLGWTAGPQTPLLYILRKQWLDAAILQVHWICGFCRKTLPSGHPRLRGILKGWAILKSGPQMLNRNSNTKSLPALTSLPRFLFSLCFISTKLSILAARIKIFTYNLSISDINKHAYRKCC